MSDLLNTAATWLAAQKRSQCTSSVTHRRGESSISLPAERGRAELAIAGDDGPVVASYDMAYWLDVADLVLDDALTAPQAGDRIDDTIHGAALTFEVMQPTESQQAFTTDAHRRRYHVFCKRVA